jgi:membrane protein DedA with SNARE-associated domain
VGGNNLALSPYVFQALQFKQKIIDSSIDFYGGASFMSGTNNTTFTAPITGYYSLTAVAYITNSSGVGVYEMYITAGGIAGHGASYHGGAQSYPSVNGVWYLTSG